MIRKINFNNIGIPFFFLWANLIFLILLLSLVGSNLNITSAEVGPPVRRANVPYLGEGPFVHRFEPAIFWFGKVDPTTNYIDVRMWYYDNYMEVMVNIIDRLLWYDEKPIGNKLTEWDAATLYLNLDGNIGRSPGSNSYRLVGQLNWYEQRADWQAAYRGNGTSWELSSVLFKAESAWRGSEPNTNTDDKGWQLTVVIPFDSLDLAGPPPDGTIWGLGVAVHDRDDASGTPIPDQIWPEQMDPDNPSTWGQLHFGRATYERPELFPTGSVMIQQGLNGALVPDAHVGGSFKCGNDVDHWSEWGEANYAGSSQINIQNQWDISDYPCFSKYYVMFPLEGVPNAEIIQSATLTMNRFGNAGDEEKWGLPPDSYIHALTIGEDWSEATLTWNNAPLPIQNISGTWVQPIQTSSQEWYSWDVTRAVIEAKENGEPLRLALYSIDGEQHSGKYFYSSDSNDWGGTVRPLLEVTWGIQGSLCDSQDVTCEYNYLPMVQQ